MIYFQFELELYEPYRKEILAAIEKCKSHIDIEHCEVELIRMKLIISREWYLDSQKLLSLLNSNEYKSFNMKWGGTCFEWCFWKPIYSAYFSLCRSYVMVIDERRFDECKYLYEKNIIDSTSLGCMGKTACGVPYSFQWKRQEILTDLNGYMYSIVDAYNKALSKLNEDWILFNNKIRSLLPKCYREPFLSSLVSYEKELLDEDRQSYINDVEKRKGEITGSYIDDGTPADWEKVYKDYINEIEKWSSEYYHDSKDFGYNSELLVFCKENYAKFINKNEVHNSILNYNDYEFDMYLTPDLVIYVEEYFSWVFKLNYIKTKMFPELQGDFDKLYGVETSDDDRTQNTRETKKIEKKSGRNCHKPLRDYVMVENKDEFIAQMKDEITLFATTALKVKYIKKCVDNGELSEIVPFSSLVDAGFDLGVRRSAWDKAMSNYR